MASSQRSGLLGLLLLLAAVAPSGASAAVAAAPAEPPEASAQQAPCSGGLEARLRRIAEAVREQAGEPQAEREAGAEAQPLAWVWGNGGFRDGGFRDGGFRNGGWGDGGFRNWGNGGFHDGFGNGPSVTVHL
ncbi:MAG: GrrA/OscA1 family cyclophane-containing rSAM-modified RiPP [Synechococcaceae cyanobacterium]|nr:GrrA/OscA1 family cyclophane-containing rSAM-modified RiPP [Synechococcaceae cyanobacterium]